MFIRWGAILFFSIFLIGCGGDGSFYQKATTQTDTDTSGDDSGTNDDTATDEPKAVSLGTLNGSDFTAGVLKVETANLQAYGTTKLYAYLVDEDGARYTESTTVTFTSTCSSNNFANLVTPVDAVNGLAESLYTANGCVGQDTITASALVNGVELSATATVEVEAAVVNSIRYVSATPSTLGIRGFGQVEESAVIFQLVDREGRPVPNQNVNFSLDTAIGGITFYPETALSDEQGQVRTYVHSGTKSTDVKVTATYAENSNIRAISDVLVIATGGADQDSMSISVSTHNPNAGNYDGTEVEVTIHASDHFNNPVPDGTKVYFTTEGGQIEPECEIKEGACSVVWSSSNPRPCYGRATILATMIGEESFTDANSNGQLDSHEIYYDMPEAFRDDDEDGVYDLNQEEFWDYNQNEMYDAADGKYNGMLCKSDDAESTHCGSLKNIYARESITLVMASDAARIQLYIYDAVQGTYVEHNNETISVPATGISLMVGLSGALSAVDEHRHSCEIPHEQEVKHSLVTNGIIQPLDLANMPEQDIPSGYQPMPVGTKMKVSLTDGEMIPQSPEIELGSTNQSLPTYMNFSIFPGDSLEPGTVSAFSVEVETKGDGKIASKKVSQSFGLVFPEGSGITPDE